jgi:hypothetical protein
MADPIVVKVSELTELIDLAAGDLITAVDVSEAVSANKTKKLQAGNLKLFTSGQLANSIVTAAQLANDAVETLAIKDANVTTAKLAAGAVTATQIADTTITGGKLVNGTITATQIANTTITGAKLVNKTITAAQIADNTITAAQIATDGVGSAEIAAGAVTQAKLSGIVRTVCIPVYGDLDSIVVANFPRRFPWVHALDGHVITRATVVLHGAVSSSGSVTVAITNAGGTAATISVSQGLSSATTTTIAASYKTAVALAPVGINVTAAGTGAKGLSVYLEMLG